ncbi:MAG: TSUP family transporter [Methanobacteriaceae archaeon]
MGLAFTGILSGLSSGLLGVGGGFVLVPLQYFLMTSMGLDSSLSLIVAIGTSLAIIIPTSLSSARIHIKKQPHILKYGLQIGLFGIIGSFIGSIVAINSGETLLKLLLAILMIFSAFIIIIDLNKILNNNSNNFNFNTKSNTNNNNFNIFNFNSNNNNNNSNNSKSIIFKSIISKGIIGIVIGFLSGLLGIGGGILLVPLLMIIWKLSIKESIGISSIFICLSAIGASISYIINGIGINIATIPYSLGYINLFNFAVIVIFSVPFAYIGSKIMYKVPEKILKYIFAILMIYLALNLLGINLIGIISSIF